MKKLILLFVIALGISTALVSCSSDDGDSGSSSIVGKWQYSREGALVSNQEIMTDYEHTSGCSKDYTQFAEDGTVVDVYYYNNGTGCDFSTDSGTYTKSGNTLNVNLGFGATESTIKKLTSSTLKVYTTYTFEGGSSTEITEFTKVN